MAVDECRPQVVMATGQVLLQRFYCKKSFTKYPVKVCPPSLQPPSDTLILIGCAPRIPISTLSHPRCTVRVLLPRVQMSIRRQLGCQAVDGVRVQHGWSDG